MGFSKTEITGTAIHELYVGAGLAVGVGIVVGAATTVSFIVYAI